MSSESLRVLTAVGADRPGLVSEISSVIHAAGGNIEDSRMAILGGEFALVLLFSGSAEAVDRVAAATRELARRLELDLVIKDTRRAERRQLLTYRLRASGVDHPGIVEAVMGELARRAVNVASLESRVVNLPLSGTPTFVLEAELHIPPDLAVDQLLGALAAVAERENLEYTFEASV